jgi:hypothetical protein
MVPSTATKVLAGNRSRISRKSSAWKFLIGIIGIRVNKKMIAGKSAIKKLNAMAEALVVKELSTMLR